MHWTRSREALYDADELAAAIEARKKAGRFAEDQFVDGHYAERSKRIRIPFLLRNTTDIPAGVCASCREPAELHDGKLWCDDCRDRAAIVNRESAARAKEAA